VPEPKERMEKEKKGIGEKLWGCHTMNNLNSQKLLIVCTFFQPKLESERKERDLEKTPGSLHNK